MAQPPPSSSSPFWAVFNRFAALNKVAYRVTGGRIGGKMPGFGAPIILVHHRGRRSGEERVSPLIGVQEGDRWVIVASKGGTDRHPAWYHNLKAAPETEIEVGSKRITVRAREVEGEERVRLWKLAVEAYPSYADYQGFAGDRRIPVLSLDRR